MTVSDLIRAGGGLSEEAYGGEADLARYEVRDGQTRKTDVVKVDLSRALARDPTADQVLAPFDFLVVKEISQWSSQETVRLEGEVRFPGEYPIERGETLQSVNEHAFADPLSAPGLADITAHVDFEIFGQAAESTGATLAARTVIVIVSSSLRIVVVPLAPLSVTRRVTVCTPASAAVGFHRNCATP